jgi:hypothetical protein
MFINGHGCMLYRQMPNMPEAEFRPLVERFVEFLDAAGFSHGLAGQAK